MGKIATEQEAYSIGKKGTPVGNKLCTKSRAIQLGCDTNGSYLDNQCVQLNDLKASVNKIQISFVGTPSWMSQKIKAVFSYPITINMQFNVYGDYMGTTYNQIYSINQSWYPVGDENHPDEYTYLMGHNQPLDNITKIQWYPLEDQEGRKFEVDLLVPKLNKFNRVTSVLNESYIVFNYETHEEITIVSDFGKLTVPKGVNFIKGILSGSTLRVEGETFDSYEYDEAFFPEERGFFVERTEGTDGSYAIGLYKDGSFSPNLGGLTTSVPIEGTSHYYGSYFRFIEPDAYDYDIYIGAIPKGMNIKFKGETFIQEKELVQADLNTYSFHYGASSFNGGTIVYKRV